MARKKKQLPLLEDVLITDVAAEGKALEYGDVMPDYMRRAEAEVKLEDGSLQKMREAKLAKFRLR